MSIQNLDERANLSFGIVTAYHSGYSYRMVIKTTTPDEGGNDSRGTQAATYDELPRDSGTYVATTRTGTNYRFDLAHLTVTRTPGPNSHPDLHDGVRRIRTIVQCRVGESGYWTMLPDECDIDFYWQLTTPIVSITAARD